MLRAAPYWKEQSVTSYFSIQEASEILKVDYKVVYRLVKEGVIPTARVGWQFRINEEDLNAYLSAQRVKQASAVQALPAREVYETAPAPRPTPGPAATSTENGTSAGAAAAGAGISKLKARQLELNFINRFDEKIADVETVRHPVTDELLHVDDWAPLRTQTEERELLMQVLNTAFLDKRTLATTPRNTTVRYTVAAKPPLVLEARVLTHLDTLLNNGADEQPADLADLMVEVDRLQEEQQKTRAALVVGLASPTGWDEEAAAFVEGSQRGAVYRHPNIRLVLVDLRSESVHYDVNDERAAAVAGLYALATARENTATLRDLLRTELADRTGLLLQEVARSLQVSESSLLDAARLMVEGGGYQLIPDRASGWILVKL